MFVFELTFGNLSSSCLTFLCMSNWLFVAYRCIWPQVSASYLCVSDTQIFSNWFLHTWYVLFTDPFPLCFSVEYPRDAGRRAARSAVDAPGQHVGGGGRGRTGERQFWIHDGSQRGREWRPRTTGKRHRTLRLQGQTGANPTDLPHRTGEIWTGEFLKLRDAFYLRIVLFLATSIGDPYRTLSGRSRNVLLFFISG